MISQFPPIQCGGMVKVRRAFCTVLLLHLIPISRRPSASLDGAWSVRSMHCPPLRTGDPRIGQSLGYTLKLIIQFIMRRPAGGPASNLRRRPFLSGLQSCLSHPHKLCLNRSSVLALVSKAGLGNCWVQYRCHHYPSVLATTDR